MMNTQVLAEKLVKNLRAGDYSSAYELFDQQQVRHLEPKAPVEAFRVLTGVEALKQKDQAMGEGIAHASLPEVGEPIVTPNAIALPYKIALELKDGNQLEIEEIIVYEVKEGKIISEQFFY